MKSLSKGTLFVATVALVVVCWSSLSLFAQPNVPNSCCETMGDCGEGERCCSPGLIGAEPCGGSSEGYCMESCRPITSNNNNN